MTGATNMNPPIKGIDMGDTPNLPMAINSNNPIRAASEA